MICRRMDKSMAVASIAKEMIMLEISYFINLKKS